ncbi:helix-turn-helix domain-containing protein [Zhouia sp. PK063]|uniref:helix-turn-helix domain-containing protein n=1 Tax=Zhouia sp. PK063 TaxID=3373602 RepID=UPI0037934064
MKNKEIIHIKSVSEYHKIKGLKTPHHPLISVVDFAHIHKTEKAKDMVNYVFDVYVIALKRGFKGKMKYGQQEYDFDEGVLSFIAPGQVFSFSPKLNTNLSGYLVLFHPDLLWKTSLAKDIKNFEFFNYSVNEALFLSDKEELSLKEIVNAIRHEYKGNMDQFSQSLIINQLALFLIYADRYYSRQFLTRKKTNHLILDQLNELLDNYYNSDAITKNGLPTVKYVSSALHVSANYLSRLLKTLTGKTTQQHIHDKLIDEAKIKLFTTNLSIGEIATALGFEHSQSFSKLFKTKTKLSPLKFRANFEN